MLKHKCPKNILITGGTGFLGSNILKNIVHNNRIILLKRNQSTLKRISSTIQGLIQMYDIEDVNVETIFKNNGIDLIIHCATNYGKKQISSLEILDANLLLPLKLLELGKKYKTDCFINTDTVLDMRVNEYSLSKAQFREWLETFAKDMVCINVEIEHFFGPDDDKTKFANYIIHCMLNNIERIDLTEGKQRRSFIYIEDVVDAFVRIIENSDKVQRGFYNYQIGLEESIEIKEFVMLVKELANNSKTELNFGALPYRQNEVMSPELDLSEIKKLGWRQSVTLKDGIIKTIEYERKK